MKKELKEILENNNIQKMKEYLKQNNSLDYVLNAKLGDYSFSFNPLMYSLFKPKDSNYGMAQLLTKELPDLEIKDLFHSYGILQKETIFYTAPESVLCKLYKHLNKDEKNNVSDYLSKHTNLDNENEFRKKFIFPEHKLEMIIKKDDAYAFNDFLSENSHFIINHQHKNYLEMCIKEQAVFCFDILKDHIKSEKTNQIKNNQINGKKIKP